MAWIRILETYRWKPTPASCIKYKPGIYNVPRRCATLAIVAGKAVRITKTRKDDDGTETAT